jgi:hypothetical protein
MKYIIKHGSIAACQIVVLPDGREVRVTDSQEPDRAKDSLPLEVLAQVNRQFGTVFSLPYASRQAFIDNSVPFEVDVEEVEVSDGVFVYQQF